MTTDDRFGRTLSTWLDDDARGRVPNHLTEVLVVTAATRQRPWWSSLERWLPMDLAATPVASRMPLVRIALVAAILLLAVLAVVLISGSQRRVPPPFGRAANGLIIHESGGDIVALDPASGRSTTLVGGAENDRIPRVSPDGTSMVFDREVGDGRHQLVLAAVDGTGERPIGPPLDAIDPPVWSPDGTRVALDAQVGGETAIRIIDTRGAATAVLRQQRGSATEIVGDLQWLHDGRTLVFRGWKPGGPAFGLWTIGVDGTHLASILPSEVAQGRESLFASLSPDGTLLAYTFVGEDKIRLLKVATGEDVARRADGAEGVDVAPVWAPDGTRLAFQRGSGDGIHIVVGPATGGAVVEIGPAFAEDSRPNYAFSPDGTKVLAWYPADGSTWLLDPAGGPGEQLTIAASDLPAWQRRAP